VRWTNGSLRPRPGVEGLLRIHGADCPWRHSGRFNGPEAETDLADVADGGRGRSGAWRIPVDESPLTALAQRVVTAAVLIPLALAGLFLLPNPAWAVASGAFMIIGVWEWGRLSGLGGLGRLGYAGALSGLGTAWWLAEGSVPLASGLALTRWILLGAVAFWLVVALPWILRGWHLRGKLLLCLVGTCVLVPAWIGVVQLQIEPSRLLALMGTVWVADTGAFFVGRRFGRHKLAPRVSPGKSWEGVAGGAVCVALYGEVLGALVPGLLPGGHSWSGLLFLEAVLLLSIVGDLFESWMKREAGVKDSGSILPGHGGVLDRIDSLTSALPAAAAVMLLRGTF
jgi:phosphatidate cytidylyltransferase